MFFPLHAAPMALSGKSSTTSSSVYLSGLNPAGAAGAPTPPAVIVSSHQTGLNAWYAGLPGWAWLVIGIACAVGLLFIGAFVYHIVDERRTSRARNRPPSIGRAFWKAAKIALFLWVLIELAKCCTGRSRRSGASSYRQVANDKADRMDNAGVSGPTSVSVTGGSAHPAYGDGGSGRCASLPRSTAGKYEPYAYKGAATTATSPERRSVSPLYSSSSAAKYLSAPSEYNSKTTLSSSIPLMTDPHLASSSRPSTRDPSPAPSATYAPGRGSHGQY